MVSGVGIETIKVKLLRDLVSIITQRFGTFAFVSNFFDF